jgi:hypothetical protein
MRHPTRLSLGFAVIFVIATVVAATDNRRDVAIVGVWRGKLDKLPAATLNVTDEAGPLQGAVVFYLIRRDRGKPATSSPGDPEPLLNLQFDGKSLTFQLSRHSSADAYTSGNPPLTFRLDLTGPDEGKLVRIPEGRPSYLRMVRENR